MVPAWLIVAAERINAGEPEEKVLAEFGYVRWFGERPAAVEWAMRQVETLIYNDAATELQVVEYEACKGEAEEDD